MKKICVPYKKSSMVAAIGVFDGVHKGHQKILKKAVSAASALSMKALVITFHPHPRRIIDPDSKINFLTTTAHKSRLIEKIGVDFLLDLKFTKKLSEMKAEDFVSKVLVGKLNIKALVVGKDFLFGRGGEGNFRLLKDIGKRYGFNVFGIEPSRIKGVQVSSTKIRKAIERGDLATASLMLGRPVSVLGTVVKGRKVGRRLGFPTANINPHHEAIPPGGVYAVEAKVLGKKYTGVLNIGIRPTFDLKKEPAIELYIFKFKRNIYGKDVEVIFRHKIRDERKFASPEALKDQIKKDIIRAGGSYHI